MNTTVRKRIEQINRGEVPQGYKRTKIGIIPEDWEVVELKDICTINPKSTNFPDRFVYIDLESVVDGKLLKQNIIEKENAPSRAQRVLRDKDVLYQLVRPYQRNNFIFRNEKTNYSTVASTGYAQLRCSAYVFLYNIINSDYFCDEVLEKCTGTNYPAINTKDLATIRLAYPQSQTEQQKIAEILQTQDRAIELQEQLIEQYKQLKKGLLDKMFPKKGSCYPEVRFPGFTAPWEHRKLGDETQITMGQSPDGTTYSQTPSKYILVQGNADLKDGWVCPRVWTTQKTKTADAGDLIMSVRAPAGSMGKTAYNVVLGRGVAGIKGNEFIFQTLVKMDTDGYWKKMAAGSTFESINSDTISNAVIIIPKDLGEQYQIGTYFKSIDILITLHQRKLEEMKNYKKALMQLLLTGIVRV